MSGETDKLIKEKKENRNLNTGHRGRVLNRYTEEGLDNFTPHEVLELLLHFTVQRKDTKAAAKQLIEHFGSLKNLFDAEIEDIVNLEIPNVTERTAAFLKLVGELPRYIGTDGNSLPVLGDEKDAGEYAKALLRGLPTERLYLINLDKRLKIIYTELIAEGSAGGTLFDIRKIFESVIRHKASCVMLAHNHPAGTLNPSKADVEMTREIARMLSEIDIVLQDHIIVAKGEYISLKRRGLI